MKKLSLLLLLLIGKQIIGANKELPEKNQPLKVLILQEPSLTIEDLGFIEQKIEEINGQEVPVIYVQDKEYNPNSYIRITPTFCMHGKYQDNTFYQYTSTKEISEQDTRCDECKKCYDETIKNNLV